MTDRDDDARLLQIDGSDKTTIIARLNDAFRCGGGSGRLAITNGVLALGTDAAVRILTRVRAFEAFDASNDPYGEHDFGSLMSDETLIFWKIDYYDIDLRCGSPDPSDPGVTTRVLTIMLAEEY